MGSSGQEKINKQSMERVGEAIETLMGYVGRFEDPDSPIGMIQGGGRERIQELLDDPYTLASVVDAIKSSGAATAHEVARSQLSEGLARLSGTSGVRSGAANRLQGQVAAGLGRNIAEANRQADIMAAQQRPTDLINALQAAQSWQGSEMSPYQALASTQLGGGQVIGGLQAPPSFAQGVGSLAGSVLGAAGSAGGFGNLFGSAPPPVTNIFGCWIAEAIFGKDDMNTHLARYWVNNAAPKWFNRLYLRYGERFAKRVEKSEILKRLLRPLFLRFAKWGAEAAMRDGVGVNHG